jgi:hypothetical protein
MEAGLHSPRLNYPQGSYIIKILKQESGDLQGSLYFPNTSKTVVFSSLWGLITQIDSDIAYNRFPQSTFEMRRWTKRTGLQKKTKDERYKSQSVSSPSLCSFLVQILYYQNATWQGTIHWIEGRKTKGFRSEFEMLKLLEEAAGRPKK